MVTPSEGLNARCRNPRSRPTKDATKSFAGARRISSGAAYCARLPAGAEDGHLVAEDSRLVDVVGDEDNCLGQITLEAQELLLEFVADHRIHGAEGLVHEEHGRIGGERPGHADALLLAARKLGRVPLAQ